MKFLQSKFCDILDGREVGEQLVKSIHAFSVYQMQFPAIWPSNIPLLVNLKTVISCGNDSIKDFYL